MFCLITSILSEERETTKVTFFEQVGISVSESSISGIGDLENEKKLCFMRPSIKIKQNKYRCSAFQALDSKGRVRKGKSPSIQQCIS